MWTEAFEKLLFAGHFSYLAFMLFSTVSLSWWCVADDELMEPEGKVVSKFIALIIMLIAVAGALTIN